ncbi:uncharacterized protein LOC131289128 [Anopheles ziemanni]|uniref:uncharacterized protein LOC131260788 n=1 Tax=Anopheles coustani TaxID=139045 RepID=UPI0026594D7A|nr:uncharacterized protein LOC131260788 [Anopheles coustani]XP_058174316.1 uncharacterized protein LOC131289128 [Anopheles ziemanni]
MAPTETKAAAPAKTAKAPKTAKKPKKGRKFTNSLLADGVRRYSKGKLAQRTKLYQLKNVKTKPMKKSEKPPKTRKRAVYIVKIAKDGKEHKVLVRKNKANLPTKRVARKRPSKQLFRNHKRYTRDSLVRGRVLILVAGRHKGKRVVLLKVLKTGLLLVTGPFELNGCPMRRINQNYVIATKTRLNLKKLRMPKHINDRYFRRVLPKKEPRGERDIFAKKEFKYVASEQRKEDQKAVDKVVLNAVKNHKEGPIVRRYLKSLFSLRSNQYPHRMLF